jgi:hypothetical protein
MSARAYTLGLFAVIALTLAAVAAFNRVVDPFWYYRDVEIAGFNAVKPRFARFERHVKPALLAREQPQAIVLGSSFAAIGFDPLDAAFTGGGRLKGFNFAFPGTAWAHAQCAFEYALRHAPVERVVLSVAPGAMPLADCAAVWTGMTVSTAELLLSTHALDNSLRTVFEQKRARPSHTREGRYHYTRDVPGAAARFREYYLRADAKTRQCRAQRLTAPVKLEPVAVAPLEALDLEGLRAVMHHARAASVELAIVVNPRHAMSLELDFACADGVARWRAIESIARVVAEEAGGQGNIGLWVFDGYDAERGERVMGREPVYWQDPEHYNMEIGARMLAAIFGGAASDGAKVAPGDATRLLARLAAQREAYLARSPWFYEDLRALAAPALR